MGLNSVCAILGLTITTPISVRACIAGDDLKDFGSPTTYSCLHRLSNVPIINNFGQ